MGETKMVHSPIVTYISVISLLTLCPPFVILLWYTMVHVDGSVSQTFSYLYKHGLRGFVDIWPKPTATAWKIIACYAAFEALLQILLPGKRAEGPISPAGNRPIYKSNGVVAYIVTLIAYLGIWWFGIFDPSIVYDHLGEIFSALIFGSLIFCVLLYVKGHISPSSSDSGSSGNIIIDLYWGMELYPRIGKHFDIKVFTNCRFGMMSWAVLAVTYCIKQYEANGRVSDSMLVNTILILVYVSKFFWWEDGYWNTMDIAHDRAGFYICWGCLVWVPSIYTSPGMYLVNHPVNLGIQLAAFILGVGIMCIFMNYDCDGQRQGKPPSQIVTAYQMSNGEMKTSLLLTSGWWGLARHFHYVPETLAAFFWTIPALYDHVLPYFYAVFLTIVLFGRAKRDDDRCRSKYGKYWKLYYEKIPSRIIPVGAEACSIGKKMSVREYATTTSAIGKLPDHLLVEIFIRVPTPAWVGLCCVKKQWAQLFQDESLWHAALLRNFPMAGHDLRRWPGPIIPHNLSKRRYAALYISKILFSTNGELDEMLGHVYLFLKDQLELSTMPPPASILHGTLIDQFIACGKSRDKAYVLASQIWVAVIDNLEENQQTFILLKRLALEGDVFLPYPYTRSKEVEWRIFEKLLTDFRDCFDREDYHNILACAKHKFQPIPSIWLGF